MSNHPISGITAVILAGGQARRMGGSDKGLIKISGVPLVQRIAKQLQDQSVDVVINANRNLDEYRKFGFPVIADVLSDFQGPLAGMLTGLNYIAKTWMITVPCDSPFISNQYIRKMRAGAKNSQTLLAVASCENRLQPVYALINKSLCANLKKYLEYGDRKIDHWYGQLNYTVVDFSASPEMFENINTPEQLQAVEDAF